MTRIYDVTTNDVVDLEQILSIHYVPFSSNNKHREYVGPTIVVGLKNGEAVVMTLEYAEKSRESIQENMNSRNWNIYFRLTNAWKNWVYRPTEE